LVKKAKILLLCCCCCSSRGRRETPLMHDLRKPGPSFLSLCTLLGVAKDGNIRQREREGGRESQRDKKGDGYDVQIFPRR
jgi:hypothetical protein